MRSRQAKQSSAILSCNGWTFKVLPHAPLGLVVCIYVLMRHLIRCMGHTSNLGHHQDINANHVFDVIMFVDIPARQIVHCSNDVVC